MSNYRRRMMQRQNDEVVDLSLQDIYGNPINRSTANCYVVRKAGKYRFPLVYGNAIKNGKVNTAAFTNNGGSFSHDFVNSLGNVITQPYMDVYEGDYELEVINSDCESSVISNLMFDEDYKYACFDINEIPLEGGNILIRIKPWSATYNETWSWHIWLWPYDLSPVEITNSTGVKYNIMPVNLASKYDSDGVHIKNWFYQWGRKDPMLLPSAWDSTTDHSPGSITKSSKAVSLLAGIFRPETFFYNNDGIGNWFGGKSYYNLWDAACTEMYPSDNDTVKTVYDPCPVGWKVPNGQTFTGLATISENNGIVNMRRYSGDTIGVKFPRTGCRANADGRLYATGMFMYYWTTANVNNNAYLLFMDSGKVPSTSKDYKRAYGMSIRPVQDENIQLDVIMISFTVKRTLSSTVNYTFQAESGMTWFEWIHSEYNTEGYYIEDNLIYDKDGLQFFEPNDSGDVLPSSNIVGGRVYELHI